MAAHAAAQTTHHATVQPHHLILGLLSEPNAIAGRAFVAAGVAFDAVRDASTAALPPADPEVPDLIPYDAAARKVLELTFREALRLGHNYVGTEHILLALLELDGEDGPLHALGLTKVGVERFVLATLGSPSA